VFRSYDFFEPSFNRERPLLGCLDSLVAQGFFTGEQLEAAQAYLQDGGRTPSDTRVVDIVMDFRRDAD
jgi:hypothetical protein